MGVESQQREDELASLELLGDILIRFRFNSSGISYGGMKLNFI